MRFWFRNVADYLVRSMTGAVPWHVAEMQVAGALVRQSSLLVTWYRQGSSHVQCNRDGILVFDEAHGYNERHGDAYYRTSLIAKPEDGQTLVAWTYARTREHDGTTTEMWSKYYVATGETKRYVAKNRGAGASTQGWRDAEREFGDAKNKIAAAMDEIPDVIITRHPFLPGYCRVQASGINLE